MELVDAPHSKCGGPVGPCRFKSYIGHHYRLLKHCWRCSGFVTRRTKFDSLWEHHLILDNHKKISYVDTNDNKGDIVENVIGVLMMLGFLLSFFAMIAIIYGIYYGIIVYVGYRVIKFLIRFFKTTLTEIG